MPKRRKERDALENIFVAMVMADLDEGISKKKLAPKLGTSRAQVSRIVRIKEMGHAHTYHLMARAAQRGQDVQHVVLELGAYAFGVPEVAPLLHSLLDYCRKKGWLSRPTENSNST